MPPSPIPSKVDQQIAIRRASGEYTEPLYAQVWVGVDRRPCILDCHGFSTSPDGICPDHDVFGEPTSGWLSC